MQIVGSSSLQYLYVMRFLKGLTTERNIFFIYKISKAYVKSNGLKLKRFITYF